MNHERETPMDVLIKIKFKDNLASPPRYSLPSPWMCRKKIYKLTLRAGLPRGGARTTFLHNESSGRGEVTGAHA